MIDIMGIINVTDDSFYPESRCLDADGSPDIEKVVRRAGRMLSEGATILDIGACSTRPGSEPAGEDVEWSRLAPVLEEIWRSFPDAVVSIDTYWSSVIRKAYALLYSIDGTSSGRLVVNDISAGAYDPLMLQTAGSLGLVYIAMHMRGTPATMSGLCDYGDVTEEVIRYFREFEARAAAAGIREWIIDPGFGFAKTVDQNYRLLRELGRLSVLGNRRILVGVSRKSMVYRLFGITPEESLPQTQVLHLAALERGATILRVHDVAEAVRTVTVFRKLQGK